MPCKPTWLCTLHMHIVEYLTLKLQFCFINKLTAKVFARHRTQLIWKQKPMELKHDTNHLNLAISSTWTWRRQFLKKPLCTKLFGIHQQPCTSFTRKIYYRYYQWFTKRLCQGSQTRSSTNLHYLAHLFMGLWKMFLLSMQQLQAALQLQVFEQLWTPPYSHTSLK